MDQGASRNLGLLSLIALSFTILHLLTDLPMRSQQAPPSKVNVNAVNLLASVRDKHGKIVRNLAKEQFTLEQDGKPQTIAYFAQESNLPLTLGLLVDTSMSQRRVLGEELNASRSFLDHILREDKDKAFVIHFDREVELRPHMEVWAEAAAVLDGKKNRVQTERKFL